MYQSGAVTATGTMNITTSNTLKVAIPPALFGKEPMQVVCGNCSRTIITVTHIENGACAYLATVVMVIVFCPCFWIPLCARSCKDVIHYCPACGANLGTYKKL